jgi:hypothetical protein
MAVMDPHYCNKLLNIVDGPIGLGIRGIHANINAKKE